MRRRVSILVLASSTMMAPGVVSAAPSKSGEASEVPAPELSAPAVRLRVETSAMGDEAKSTRAWVLRDGSAALADAGVEVTADADAEVLVTIEPQDLGYTVVLEIREGGAAAPSSVRGPRVCETCTRSEVVAMVGRELAWVAGWLAGTPSEEGPTDEGAGNGDGATEDALAVGVPEEESPSSRGDSPRRKLHALGWAGIGVGVVGLGTMIGGFAVVLRDYKARGEPGDYHVPRVRPKRAGWAMVGVGATALVGGTVMLVWDLVKGQRSGVTAGPWMEPAAGGLWVRRRF